MVVRQMKQARQVNSHIAAVWTRVQFSWSLAKKEYRIHQKLVKIDALGSVNHRICRSHRPNRDSKSNSLCFSICETTAQRLGHRLRSLDMARMPEAFACLTSCSRHLRFVALYPEYHGSRPVLHFYSYSTRAVYSMELRYSTLNTVKCTVMTTL